MLEDTEGLGTTCGRQRWRERPTASLLPERVRWYEGWKWKASH